MLIFVICAQTVLLRKSQENPFLLPCSDIQYTFLFRNHQGRRVNPVSLFFHSLLPDFNPDDVEHLVEEIDIDPERQGNLAQMRGNIQTLMGAMRDLLLTFQQPEDGTAEENVEFEDEWDWWPRRFGNAVRESPVWAAWGSGFRRVRSLVMSYILACLVEYVKRSRIRAWHTDPTKSLLVSTFCSEWSALFW